MEDRKNDHARIVLYEERFVGEPAQESATDDAVYLRIVLWISQDRIEDGVHGKEEIEAKASDAVSVPVERVRHHHADQRPRYVSRRFRVQPASRHRSAEQV